MSIASWRSQVLPVKELFGLNLFTILSFITQEHGSYNYSLILPYACTSQCSYQNWVLKAERLSKFQAGKHYPRISLKNQFCSHLKRPVVPRFHTRNCGFADTTSNPGSQAPNKVVRQKTAGPWDQRSSLPNRRTIYSHFICHSINERLLLFSSHYVDKHNVNAK